MVYYYTISPIIAFIWVIYVICGITTVNTIKWPTAEQELQDERNDAELIKAVQTSMYEWEKTHKHHRKKRANEKIACYGELGCFEDSGPFGYLDMLPASPEEINTKFFFHSTKNRSEKPLIELNYLNLTEAWTVFDDENNENLSVPEKSVEIAKRWETLKNFEGFDQLSVRVIVHGFGASCPHVWIYEMRTALMAVEDCIVICVDWENGANFPNYVRAAANTRLVGKQLAMLLKGLKQYKGLDYSRVHIIGFSLGAHVSGFAGAELPGLQRITGLDPAGPLFESQHPKARLDSTDAQFVDVIHSNGENLILGGLGSWQPMGHVDFYPNGGRVQNGCSNLFVGAVTDFIWSPAAAIEGRSLCNHRRSYKFFTDSVAPRCLFPAFPCASYDDFLKGHCFPCVDNSDSKCGDMGYYADRSTGRGQLFLVTREEEPFCAHQFNIVIYSSENDLPLRTLGRIEAVLEGDGTLNETFAVTEKDDTELIAGDVISRILVPHPALGFPHSISLTYKSYSGWLSKGLPNWIIHKVVLTDSFGKNMSICKQHIYLESEKPVYLELQPGDCHVPDENDVGFVHLGDSVASAAFVATTEKKDLIAVIQENNSSAATITYNDDVDRLREKKDVINLGQNFKITSNNSFTYSEPNDQLPWQPLLDGGNSLEKNLVESSRSFPTDDQFKRISNDQVRMDNEESGRSISSTDKDQLFIFSSERREIQEPILKSTTTKTTTTSTRRPANYRKMKTVFVGAPDAAKPRDNNYFTIQLLPFRLGELIERAERYARETLLPLISEQAPRFFGFGVGDLLDNNGDNRPKYFPPLGEIAEETAQASVRSERRINLPPHINNTLIEMEDFNGEDEVQSNKTLSTSTTIPKNDFNNSTASAESLELDIVTQPAPKQLVEESRSSKNILSLLRPKDKPNSSAKTADDSQQPPIDRRSYYTNINFDHVDGNQFDKDDDLGIVHIELPTYKPAITTTKAATTTTAKSLFPYRIESAQQYEENIQLIPLKSHSNSENKA